jgi:hypothetical protein
MFQKVKSIAALLHSTVLLITKVSMICYALSLTTIPLFVAPPPSIIHSTHPPYSYIPIAIARQIMGATALPFIHKYTKVFSI